MSFRLVLLAFAIKEGIHGKGINSFMGRYIIYTDRFYMCEPNLPSKWYIRASHFNPQKPKELQVLTGNAMLSFLTDDSTWLKIVIDVRSNNQWKENAFVFYFKDNACRALKENIPEIYNEVFKQGEVIKGAHCMVKPGVYEVNKAPANWTCPNIPIMPYGHYRYRSWFGKPEKVSYGCWAVDFHIIPKPV
ncbi:uncharacterized protein LOC127751844 [Frankliniella occidentalis]|uniref:Uncharacterized protein LOC127751844 n=1 Tax=Frankliniella occidentalis TaxID=133901 RepID=A0A9C6XAA1_FRAOC|nr:uncharacterized protein LOC127751844 [Frankliniella occidentalis]